MYVSIIELDAQFVKLNEDLKRMIVHTETIDSERTIFCQCQILWGS